MITGVAIRLRDGTVHSLPKPARHCNLFAEYNARIVGTVWEVPWKGWPSDEVRHGVQGFVTDAGDFLDRYEARDHAVACRQVLAHRVGLGLFSEDLW